MKISSLKSELISSLNKFRVQGQQIAEINPISAMADEIHGRIYRGDIKQEDLQSLTTLLGADLVPDMAKKLRHMTGLNMVEDLTKHLKSYTKLDLSRPIYRAVFTAHPIFALRRDQSMALCHNATRTDADLAAYNSSDHNSDYTVTEDFFTPRQSVSLKEEHEEAMAALTEGRRAIRRVHACLLEQRMGQVGWLDQIPQCLAVSTWVGYDLDGRSDITWAMSLALRLKEKALGLSIYIDEIDQIGAAAGSVLADIKATLLQEHEATLHDLARFEALTEKPESFTAAANALTERSDKLISTVKIVESLHQLAKEAEGNPSRAIALLCLAGDLKSHGLGMGDIHFRINAVQLRNAMRSVDGRILSVTGEAASSRVLLERLAQQIREEQPLTINFQSLEEEQATARRQLMLAAQFLKHIDADRPIRLLIAECEQPLTALTALYLTHLFGIKDKIDISPLFETTTGLEQGAAMIDQLLRQDVYRDYIRQRGQLCIETGYSDAGRFMGQIAASLAIERLQLKTARAVHEAYGTDIALVMFNTHGESWGRGRAGETIQERQDHILSPYVRSECKKLGLYTVHESSFQGGDGYRLFGNLALAEATIKSLLHAEIRDLMPEESQDPFYDRPDFSLDLFLALKSWHDRLFENPDYGEFLDLFGSHLLVKSGSRPSKRVVAAGEGRKDPSKMRAIPHNATLQQMGFLANVISGIGYAAHVDRETFIELHATSPRLRALTSHALRAKTLGSLNTTLAYGRILDSGFWIDRAYHGHEVRNLKAYRKLAALLQDGTKSMSVRKTVWVLRNDLMDLYRLSRVLKIEGVRTEGEARLSLDLLHAIRIAVILNSLSLVCQVPRFTESNELNNDDVIRLALRLDFPSAHQVIVEEFGLDKHKVESHPELSEPANYQTESKSTRGYSGLHDKVLDPLATNHALILKISQMISAHYGAHG